MGYCDGGGLLDAIVESKSGFTEPVAMRLAKQMLKAICYLHSQKICHRDLKPNNFLLAKKEPIETSTVKLIDFGTAKLFREGDEKMTTKICTLNYVAPEILSPQCTSYTEKCDIWSLGVLIYLLLCGQLPFSAESDIELLDLITTRKYAFVPDQIWGAITDDAVQLIEGMLIVDPSKRCSANEASNHAWFIMT